MIRKRLKISRLALFFLVISIFLGFSLFKCMNNSNALKNALPYLIPGETLPNLDLISVDEQAQEFKELPPDKPVLFYIFPRISCLSCDKNIIFLEKFSNILGDSVSIRGIVLSNLSKAYNFSREANFKFPVYIPEDSEQFMKTFRVKLNLSQTLVCQGNEIRHAWLGDLKSQDATAIIKLVRSMRKDASHRGVKNET
jgi:peroxiredoxin